MVTCTRCGESYLYDLGNFVPHVCRNVTASFPPAETPPRLAALEFETRSRLNKLEQQVQEIAARLPEVKAKETHTNVVLASADPPPMGRVWVREGEGSGLDDIARSLAERKTSAPASPREEGIALEPKKKRVRDRAHHAAYMRAWRSRQILRKYGIPA
jgi:hypothetical protein